MKTISFFQSIFWNHQLSTHYICRWKKNTLHLTMGGGGGAAAGGGGGEGRPLIKVMRSRVRLYRDQLPTMGARAGLTREARRAKFTDGWGIKSFLRCSSYFVGI